jgi:hypothetical protein
MTHHDDLYRMTLQQQHERIRAARRERMLRELRPTRRRSLDGLGGMYGVFLYGMLMTVLVMLAAFFV